MNNLIKSIFKTVVYFLDQTDRMAGDVRDLYRAQGGTTQREQAHDGDGVEILDRVVRNACE